MLLLEEDSDELAGSLLDEGLLLLGVPESILDLSGLLLGDGNGDELRSALRKVLLCRGVVASASLGGSGLGGLSDLGAAAVDVEGDEKDGDDSQGALVLAYKADGAVLEDLHAGGPVAPLVLPAWGGFLARGAVVEGESVKVYLLVVDSGVILSGSNLLLR